MTHHSEKRAHVTSLKSPSVAQVRRRHTSLSSPTQERAPSRARTSQKRPSHENYENPGWPREEGALFFKVRSCTRCAWKQLGPHIARATSQRSAVHDDRHVSVRGTRSGWAPQIDLIHSPAERTTAQMKGSHEAIVDMRAHPKDSEQLGYIEARPCDHVYIYTSSG